MITAEASTVEAARAAPPADSRIVARNSVILFTRYLMLYGLNAVLMLFLPRYLGAEGLGQVTFATSFASLFAIAVSLGTKQYLVKEVARDQSRTPDYLSASIGMRVLTGSVVLGVIAIIALLSSESHVAAQVMVIAAITMVVGSFVQLMTAIAQGQEDMSWQALAEVANKVVILVAGIIVLMQGFGVLAYVIVLLAGMLLQLALMAGYIGHRVSMRVTFNVDKIKFLVMDSMPFLMMGVLLNVYSQIDVVMLRYLTGNAVVGWYAAALQIYNNTQFVPLVLTTALLPTLSRVHATNVAAMATLARKSIIIGVLVMVPVALAISLLADEIMTLLPYPDTFQHSVPVLSILALTIPVTALLTILGTIVVAADQQKTWAKALLASVVLNIAMNAILIPYTARVYGNGAIGPTIASLVSEGLMIVVGFRLMPKGIIDRPTIRGLWKLLFCGVAMLLIGLLIKAIGAGSIPAAAVALATYAGLALATRVVTPRDLRSLRQVITSRLKAARPSRS